MIPSKTRARLWAVEQQLSDPPPARLDGQTAIPLVWRQEALWGERVPDPGPAPARQRGKRRSRRARHVFDLPARPVTRPRRDHVHGRRVALVALTGGYL
ncbi:hypothetical protein [Streptomyces roseolilacinus]|uniref:hypothetical protein n=1 Tax=Streptomyces roseolilacinus TaxID=66904 RepID=UPI003808230C